MWDGVIESGKCITIYYDISGFVKDLKEEQTPLAAHMGYLEGFEELIIRCVILGYGYTPQALRNGIKKPHFSVGELGEFLALFI